MWDNLQQPYASVPYQAAQAFLTEDIFSAYVDFAVTSTKEGGQVHWWLTGNPRDIYTRVIVMEITHAEAERLVGRPLDVGAPNR